MIRNIEWFPGTLPGKFLRVDFDIGVKDNEAADRYIVVYENFKGFLRYYVMKQNHDTL